MKKKLSRWTALALTLGAALCFAAGGAAADSLQTITAYLVSGIRIAELGASAFAVKQPDGTIKLPEIDYVRIAISRRVYTNSHMDIIAETLGELYKSGSPNFKGMDKKDWGRADSHFNSHYIPEFK